MSDYLVSPFSTDYADLYYSDGNDNFTSSTSLDPLAPLSNTDTFSSLELHNSYESQRAISTSSLHCETPPGPASADAMDLNAFLSGLSQNLLSDDMVMLTQSPHYSSLISVDSADDGHISGTQLMTDAMGPASANEFGLLPQLLEFQFQNGLVSLKSSAETNHQSVEDQSSSSIATVESAIAGPAVAATTEAAPAASIVVPVKRKRGRPAGKRASTKKPYLDEKVSGAVKSDFNSVVPDANAIATATAADSDALASNNSASILSSSAAASSLSTTTLASSGMSGSNTTNLTSAAAADSTSAPPVASKQQRKKAHSMIERRYRNNLNERIAELRLCVPALNPAATATANAGVSVTRLNKANILRKATEYICSLKAEYAEAQADCTALHRLCESLPGGVDALRAWRATKVNNKTVITRPGTTSYSPPPSSPDDIKTVMGISPMEMDADEDDDDDDEEDVEVIEETVGRNFSSGRLMAVMLVSISALYAPSPFGNIHQQQNNPSAAVDGAGTTSRMMSRAFSGLISSLTEFAGPTAAEKGGFRSEPQMVHDHVDILGVLSTGATALWLLIKMILLVVSVFSLILTLSQSRSTKPTNNLHRHFNPAQASKSAASSVVWLTIATIIELLKFISVHIFGYGHFVEYVTSVIPGGRRWLLGNTRRHARKAKIGLCHLDHDIMSISLDVSRYRAVTGSLCLAFHIATHAYLARYNGINKTLSCRSHLTTAIIFKMIAESLKNASIFETRVFIPALNAIAHYLWLSGLHDAAELPASLVAHDSSLLAWFADPDLEERLVTVFNSHVWIDEFHRLSVVSLSSLTNSMASARLLARFKSCVAAQLLLDTAVTYSSSLVASPHVPLRQTFPTTTTPITTTTTTTPAITTTPFSRFSLDLIESSSSFSLLTWAATSLSLLTLLSTGSACEEMNPIVEAWFTHVRNDEEISSFMYNGDDKGRGGGGGGGSGSGWIYKGNYGNSGKVVASVALYAAVLVRRVVSSSTISTSKPHNHQHHKDQDRHRHHHIHHHHQLCDHRCHPNSINLKTAIQTLRTLNTLLNHRKVSLSTSTITDTGSLQPQLALMVSLIEFAALSWALESMVVLVSTCTFGFDRGDSLSLTRLPFLVQKSDEGNKLPLPSIQQPPPSPPPPSPPPPPRPSRAAKKGMLKILALMRKLLPNTVSAVRVGRSVDVGDAAAMDQVAIVKSWILAIH